MRKIVLGVVTTALICGLDGAAMADDCVDTITKIAKANTMAMNKSTASTVTESTTSILRVLFASTKATVTALQGNATQVSTNIRVAIAPQALIAEAASNQATQRLVQGDRVAAAHTYQFSTPLCQAATGGAIQIGMTAAAVPTTVKRSQVNAMRTAGTAAATQKVFDERSSLFCDAGDPACSGKKGARPEADRMPGAILAMSRFESAADRTQATWVVQNLTQPIPVPALTARQVEQAGGREAYLKRGLYETLVNLAKDMITNIFVTRRELTGTPQFYNALAAEAGLPSAPGNVSQEDMTRMRQRDRFTPAYYDRLAELDEMAMYREWAASEAAKVEQTYRMNELMEQGVLLMSGSLSTLVDSKLNNTAGRIN